MITQKKRFNSRSLLGMFFVLTVTCFVKVSLAELVSYPIKAQRSFGVLSNSAERGARVLAEDTQGLRRLKITAAQTAAKVAAPFKAGSAGLGRAMDMLKTRLGFSAPQVPTVPTIVKTMPQVSTVLTKAQAMAAASRESAQKLLKIMPHSSARVAATRGVMALGAGAGLAPIVATLPQVPTVPTIVKTMPQVSTVLTKAQAMAAASRESAQKLLKIMPGSARIAATRGAIALGAGAGLAPIAATLGAGAAAVNAVDYYRNIDLRTKEELLYDLAQAGFMPTEENMRYSDQLESYLETIKPASGRWESFRSGLSDALTGASSRFANVRQHVGDWYTRGSEGLRGYLPKSLQDRVTSGQVGAAAALTGAALTGAAAYGINSYRKAQAEKRRLEQEAAAEDRDEYNV